VQVEKGEKGQASRKGQAVTRSTTVAWSGNWGLAAWGRSERLVSVLKSAGTQLNGCISEVTLPGNSPPL
jgi:hypothetical protein